MEAEEQPLEKREKEEEDQEHKMMMEWKLNRWKRIAEGKTRNGQKRSCGKKGEEDGKSRKKEGGREKKEKQG